MRISDWSSDVCSSDLLLAAAGGRLWGWFALAAIIIGGIWGGVFGTAGGPAGTGAGFLAGASAGLALAAQVGYGLLVATLAAEGLSRSEEHTSELPSLMRIPSAVFCLKKQNIKYT